MPVIPFGRAKVVSEPGFKSALRRSNIYIVASLKMDGSKGADRYCSVPFEVHDKCIGSF